jgi:hypothetical protein
MVSSICTFKRMYNSTTKIKFKFENLKLEKKRKRENTKEKGNPRLGRNLPLGPIN